MLARGISLHLGLNQVDAAHYEGWSGPLKSCEADAGDLRAVAVAKGFQATILRTREATRDATVAAIKSAADALREGDIFLLTYSGHGGQVPDRDGDEEDLRDETWCLFDAQLIDDELRALWSRFESGTRILVISDSCHSGSVVRGSVSGLEAEPPTSEAVATVREAVGTRYRFMPAGASIRVYRRNRRFYERLQKAIPTQAFQFATTVRLLSACQDDQLALEGTLNGLFTGRLLRVFRSGKFKGDYHEFHRAVLQGMPAFQTPKHVVLGTPNPEYDRETPFSI